MESLCCEKIFVLLRKTDKGISREIRSRTWRVTFNLTLNEK